MDNTIYYKGGYKYQLVKDYSVQIKYLDINPYYKDIIIPLRHIETDFITFQINGLLTMHKGYAWDGPSGPTIDTKDSLRGSLVHDALYQLIREGLIDKSHKKICDEIFYRLCIEDGMCKMRAAYWKQAVVLFGSKACEVGSEERKIMKAP